MASSWNYDFEKRKEIRLQIFFHIIKIAVTQVTETLYRPSCLVADSARAITNGFELAMEYGKDDKYDREICLQHVKRNLDKHLNLVTKENREKIKEDIYILQACKSRDIFDKVEILWIEKWQEEANFVAYFNKVWLDPKRRGWFQGYVIGIPDHNNNNEADNRWIKEDQGRKRLGLISFLSHAETTLVRDWS